MSLRRLTWTAYLLLGCEGYLIYSVGYITPYLQSGLGAPPWAAAMPTSVMAVGLVVAGFVANRVVRRIGSQAAIRLWIALMAAAAVLMALAVSIWPILAGALLLGIGISGVLVHVITTLADRANGVYLMRAVLWSVVGGVLGPIALSAAARTIGWNLGPVLVVPLLLALAVVIPASPARDASDAADAADAAREPALGRAYWLTWAYLALGVAAEFSFVTWGTQVAVAQAGLGLADATALASLFVVGEVLGRLALSAGPGTRVDLRLMLGASTVLGAIGGVLLWIAGLPALAGAGMLLGGLGVSVMYPLATRLAVAHSPDAPVKASARLTTASGAAIFAAPLLLGLMAGIAGVISAWALLIAILLAALAVLRLIPRPPTRGPRTVPAAAVTAASAGSE